MPLLELKCTNCNAALQFTPEKGRFYCPYCGSLYLHEPLIQESQFLKPQLQIQEFDIQSGELLKYRGSSFEPVIPESVYVIGERAFAGTLIHSVTLPNNIQEIRAYAFVDCIKLKAITLPSSLISIGTRAFFRCFSLKQVTWASDTIPYMRTDDGFPFLGTPYMNTLK